jgi:hypothetical protein
MALRKQFDGPQRAELREALLNAFPASADFATFLSDSMDLSFAQVVVDAHNYTNQIRTLLETLNGEGRIATFLIKACASKPNNPKLSEFAAKFGFMPSERGSAGFLIPKQYDRSYQVGGFTEAFNQAIEKHPTVQRYLVFGEKYEAHRSLFQRLVEECIGPAATAKWGEADGVVLPIEVLEWPSVRTLPEFQKRTSQLLYAATKSTAKPGQRSYGLLSGTPGFRQYKIVAVGHKCTLASWSPSFAEQLRWYLEDFWRPEPLKPADPALLLFLQIECSEAMAAASTTGPSQKEATLAVLDGLTKGGAEGAPVLLDELPALEDEDVKIWFERFLADVVGPALDAEEQAKALRSRAKTRRDGIRRTDDIERLLSEVYDKANADLGDT